MKPATARLTLVPLAAALAVLPVLASAAPAAARDVAAAPRQLAVRCDDVGMCHAVNLALLELLASGVPFSASVMVPCPWFSEAAAILARHPEIGVGVHLTLNSEWRHYRWGPVLGRTAVPSLVDRQGYFHHSEADFSAHRPVFREVEAELRAQIERAKAAGLRIDYLDTHMLTAYSTDELRALVERLAREYRLGIATYFGERSASLWDVPPEDKLARLLAFVRTVGHGLTLAVAHLGRDVPEMAALVDANNPADPFRVAQHRQAELDAFSSAAFRAAVASAGIELVTYRQVVERLGLDAMRRPEGPTGYSVDLSPAP